MSEVKYESKIVRSASSAHAIYCVCSDFRNLERVKDLIPQDRVQEMEVLEDLVRFKVDGLGQKIGVRIVAKEEDNYVKYGIENAPVDGNFWMQCRPAEEGAHIRLTLKADLPMMFKMMLDKKLQNAVDQAADMMAQMPFEEWSKEA